MSDIKTYLNQILSGDYKDASSTIKKIINGKVSKKFKTALNESGHIINPQIKKYKVLFSTKMGNSSEKDEIVLARDIQEVVNKIKERGLDGDTYTYSIQDGKHFYHFSYAHKLLR